MSEAIQDEAAVREKVRAGYGQMAKIDSSRVQAECGERRARWWREGRR